VCCCARVVLCWRCWCKMGVPVPWPNEAYRYPANERVFPCQVPNPCAHSKFNVMSAPSPTIFSCTVPGCTFRSVHGSAVEIHAATSHVVHGFPCALCTDRAPFPSRSSYLRHRTAAHPQLRTFATGSSSSTVTGGLVVSDGRGGATSCVPVLAGMAVACPCCSQPMAEAAPGVQTHLLTVHGWTDVAAYCFSAAQGKFVFETHA